MNENRKNAYRYLLYWAMLRIRGVEGAFYARSLWSYLSPKYWRDGFHNVKYSGALADCLHNLASFSSKDFVGFEEEWFWDEVNRLKKRFPNHSGDYQSLFENRLAELESMDAQREKEIHDST